MSKPIVVDLPHNLGVEEARRRIAGGIGSLANYIPGGSAEVESGWRGDVMDLHVRAMGQEVRAELDVRPNVVRVEVVLPAMLGFFAGKVEALLRSKGGQLLEDRRNKD